jgi:replication-associated recombination protein RarA
LNQFDHTIDKAIAVQIFTFLRHYPPGMTKTSVEPIIRAEAAANVDSLAPADAQVKHLPSYGIKDLTTIVESRKAVLIVVAWS